MDFKLACITILVISAILVHSAPINNVKLRFRLATSGCLNDKDNGTLTDITSLDWGDVLEFEFDRNKNPRWHFKVNDQENGREDESAVKVYVDVADYVDNHQRLNVHFSKKGCPIIISAMDPVTAQTGGAFITQDSVDGFQFAPPVTVYQVYHTPVAAPVLKLRFKVSTRDLPDNDKLGLLGHFVEVYYTENGSTKETKFGRSEIINDTNNPDWKEVFEFDYDRSKNQKWLFRVYDHYEGAKEDPAVKVWMDVNDYVAKGQKLTSNLSPKGTLNITTVDSPTESPVLVSQQPHPQQVVLAPNQSQLVVRLAQAAPFVEHPVYRYSIVEEATVGNLEQTTVENIKETTVGSLKETTIGNPEQIAVGSLE